MDKMRRSIKKDTAGLTVSALKWFALSAMFLDHFAAVFLLDYMFQGHWNDMQIYMEYIDNPQHLLPSLIYALFRYIGRLSFPIYCFCIAEGFHHTTSRRRYALRLLLFALISEIPYDYGIHYKIYDYGNQNIFLTLLIGLLVIWGVDWVKDCKKMKEKKVLIVILQTLIIFLGAVASFYLKADYGYAGVMAIVVIYLIQKDLKIQSLIYGEGMVFVLVLKNSMKGWKPETLLAILLAVVVIAVCVFIPKRNIAAILVACGLLVAFNSGELLAFFSAIPISLYNGRKGKGGKFQKWFFYFFYPCHLGLLILLRYLLGYQGILL